MFIYLIYFLTVPVKWPLGKNNWYMYMFGFFSQRGAWFRSLVSPLLCVCPEQSSGDAPGSVEMDSVWCGEPGHFSLPLTEEYGDPGHFLLPLTEQSIYADVGEVGFFRGGEGVVNEILFCFSNKRFFCFKRK